MKKLAVRVELEAEIVAAIVAEVKVMHEFCLRKVRRIGIGMMQ